MFAESPVSTIIFIIIIVLSSSALFGYHRIIQIGLLHPYSIVRRQNLQGLLISGWIHANWGHLLFNLITFYFFAFALEQTIGSFYFLVVYLVSLVAGDALTVLLHKNNDQYYSLGASGAITGVLFSFILFYPMEKIYLFLIPIGIPAWIFAILYVIGSIYAARSTESSINHEAHLGGALGGVLATVALIPESIRYFLSQF